MPATHLEFFKYLTYDLKNKFYIIGLILIIVSFIICGISFWLLFYGVPVYIIGTIFVILSEKPFKTKLLTTILPVITYLPLTYIFLLAYNYTTPKTFLISAEYQGAIRIVYEEKCGIKLHKLNGRQILQFPESGILILNEKFDDGINNEYFLIDKDGNRTKIDEIIDFKDSSKKLPFISIGGAGSFVRDNQSKDITYSDFYLYNKDTVQIDNYKLSQQFDSLMWKVVNDCRASK